MKLFTANIRLVNTLYNLYNVYKLAIIQTNKNLNFEISYDYVGKLYSFFSP